MYFTDIQIQIDRAKYLGIKYGKTMSNWMETKENAEIREKEKKNMETKI